MNEKLQFFEGRAQLLHGGDYNPDQWQATPEVIDEDFRLMKLAHCNLFSVGIFSWTSYAPADGDYRFDWLDQIMDRMAAGGTLYFQWRKSNGNLERFHGAEVDHVGHEHTRCYRDVAEPGELYEAAAGKLYGDRDRQGGLPVLSPRALWYRPSAKTTLT